MKQVIVGALGGIVRQKRMADAQAFELLEEKQGEVKECPAAINCAVHVESDVADPAQARIRSGRCPLRCHPGVLFTQPSERRNPGSLHTISPGHLGSASRKARPYCLAKIRLSSTTTIPVSVLVRMSRPTPWRNFR